MRRRYVVVTAFYGASVVDTKRGRIRVAWCGDSTLASDEGCWSVRGAKAARDIARALNAAEAARLAAKDPR